MSITLRYALATDAGSGLQFIQSAREHQKEQGFVQWTDDYPNLDIILEDIQKGRAYLLENTGRAFGYLCIDFAGEPSYDDIEGQWLSTQKYAVIHRMAFAVHGRGHGASREAFGLARELCLSRDVHAIRIDTHQSNKKMQHILQREGFQYCGTVYFAGSPRMAYELDF